ncbi:MAG: ABC transporter substrate-binding protein [Actinomycetia bacterium]|nr:ABC transporter substrate-binding protein [Actinomycetes bacterium]
MSELVGKRELVVLQDDIAPGLDVDGPSVVHDGVHDILESTMEPSLEYPATLQDGILIPNYLVDWDGFAPRLAESWERTTDTTWTFRLRRGVLSCAGNEFTAADVIWSFQGAKSVSGAAPIAWYVSTGSGGLINAGQYANAEVDNTFFASQNTIGADRVADLERLQDIIMDELPMIQIALVPSEIAVGKGHHLLAQRLGQHGQLVVPDRRGRHAVRQRARDRMRRRAEHLRAA